MRKQGKGRATAAELREAYPDEVEQIEAEARADVESRMSDAVAAAATEARSEGYAAAVEDLRSLMDAAGLENADLAVEAFVEEGTREDALVRITKGLRERAEAKIADAKRAAIEDEPPIGDTGEELFDASDPEAVAKAEWQKMGDEQRKEFFDDFEAFLAHKMLNTRKEG